MPTQREKEKRQIRYTDAKKVAEAQGEGFSPTAYTVPDGMSMFRFRQARTYNIDIIPYIVGKGNPRADEGMVHFERTYFVHQKVGPNNDSFPCLAKNFGKKCPICQYRAKLGMDPKTKKDVLKALEPKTRQLWIVRDRDDLEKGLQLMDAAYYKSWGELVKSKIKAGDEDAAYHNFFHLDGGMYLKVTVEEDSWDGKKFFKATNIEMRPRQKPLKSTLLDKAPCLDELLIEKSFKELKELFLQISDDDEDEDDVEDGSELEDEDEDNDDSEVDSDNSDEDEDEEKPSKKPKQGKKKDPDEDEEEDSDSEDDDEEAPKPSRKDGKAGKKGSKKDEVESDDDEDDLDDSDDGEDSEDDEDSEEGDEDSETVTFGKGDEVTGVYKAKKFSGKVERVEKRKGKPDLIILMTKGGNKRVMGADELALTKKAKKKAEADDEGEDEEEETPSKKPKTSSKPASKTGKTGKKPAKKEEDDEEDDIPFGDEDPEDEDE
jgi:hypothetical protein